MLTSLRKRVDKVRFGAYSWWRVLHAITGLLAAILLVLHTGLQASTNNNLLLLICFLGILTLGALTALSICLENIVPHTVMNYLRKYQLYLHIVMAWPLPILLGMHILSVYYF
jgi:nitrite reductase (NADH) large subunit